MLPESFYVNWEKRGEKKSNYQILNESTGGKKKVWADFSGVASEDECISTMLPSRNKIGRDSGPS